MGRLRVHGTIFEAPEKIPTGAHHTLNIALNTPLTIVKEKWTKQQIDRLKRASCASEKPIIIVSIDDENYAIGVTAQYGVNVKIEERIKLPGKLEAEKRSDAIKKYFDQVLASLRQVRANSTQPVVIIGVGYVKNDFARYVKNEAEDIAKEVLDVKSVNNGGTTGINEALRSGILLNAVKQLRVAEETEIVEELLKRLGKDEARVTYGFEEVQKAAEAGATEKLVIADSLLREATDDERLRIEEVMRQVEDKRGEIIVVSTENEAGNQLLGLGGIAALLRFGIS
jgi:protein pelota